MPARTEEIKALTGQLYTSWDKILVDLRDRRSGGSRDYEEKIRTVKTQLPDASGKDGDTTSDESWVEVSRATYQVSEKNIGMAIAHKPAGKYDTEADDVAEPAGFAYMAPVAQERNQYGYWDHRDGGNFWMWYGQYALLRDLLWGHSYQPDSVLRVGVLPHCAHQRPDLLRPRRIRRRAQVRHARHLHPAALFREPLHAQRGRLQQFQIRHRGLAPRREQRRAYLRLRIEAAQLRLSAQKLAEFPSQFPAAFRRAQLREAPVGGGPGASIF